MPGRTRTYFRRVPSQGSRSNVLLFFELCKSWGKKIAHTLLYMRFSANSLTDQNTSVLRLGAKSGGR